MEIEVGKLYYCPLNNTLIRVKESRGIAMYYDNKELFITDTIGLPIGKFYIDALLVADSPVTDACYLIEEDPDKPSPFDKAKKAYDIYMATIHAIEQQVKDNINKQTN